MFERLADEDFAYLTTTGRRTGRDHTIEIWFGLGEGRVYLYPAAVTAPTGSAI